MQSVWRLLRGGKGNGGDSKAAADGSVVDAQVSDGDGEDSRSLPVASMVDSILVSSARLVTRTETGREIVSTASPVPIHTEYRLCRTRDEKIAWLQSEAGQRVLNARPLMMEYYQSGHIFRLIENKHWKIRLEEWLSLDEPSSSAAAATSASVDEISSAKIEQNKADEEGQKRMAIGKALAMEKGGTVSSPAVPFGLTLPKTEQEKLNERDDWIGQRYVLPPLEKHFAEYYSKYRCETMSSEDKMLLLTEGFTILRNVVPPELLQRARDAVNQVIREDDEVIHYMGKKKNREALSDRMKKRREHGPYFLSGGSNHIDILSLFYETKIHSIVENLLHNTINKKDVPMKFRVLIGGAQIAYRFSQPRPLFYAGKINSRGEEIIGGKQWHVDGLENGIYGSFSFLIGFALNDQQGDYSGNLFVHPGSHYSLLPYLKDYFNNSDATLPSDDPDLFRARSMAASRVPRPELKEPVQVSVNAGDVVIALHKVAHGGAPNYSSEIRRMIYFRVSHKDHATLRSKSFDNIWIEYEGMQDL